MIVNRNNVSFAASRINIPSIHVIEEAAGLGNTPDLYIGKEHTGKPFVIFAKPDQSYANLEGLSPGIFVESLSREIAKDLTIDSGNNTGHLTAADVLKKISRKGQYIGIKDGKIYGTFSSNEAWENVFKSVKEMKFVVSRALTKMGSSIAEFVQRPSGISVQDRWNQLTQETAWQSWNDLIEHK